MFIRSGIKIEHPIETLDLELVPDHLAMGGTGSCIADGPVIIDALHSWNRGSDNTFSGNICRDYPERGIFQIIQGVNEQHDFSNGLNTNTATEAASKPLRMRRGE
jgi:hypothetical protein